MDGQMNRRKISPFYRTSSPIGAAALLPSTKTKEKQMQVEQGKGTADHLMPLGDWFSLNNNSHLLFLLLNLIFPLPSFFSSISLPFQLPKSCSFIRTNLAHICLTHTLTPTHLPSLPLPRLTLQPSKSNLLHTLFLSLPPTITTNL